MLWSIRFRSFLELPDIQLLSLQSVFRPLETVPSGPTTTDITVIHKFLILCKFQEFVCFFAFCHFYSVVRRDGKIYLIIRSFWIIIIMRVFHISVSWWFFTWSLSDCKSPGLFSVFCGRPLISKSFSSLTRFWGLLQVHQLKLKTPSHSRSIGFF